MSRRPVPLDAPQAAQAPCPCGLPRALARCCGRWLDGAPAPDARTLMRSRYAAFVLGRADHLVATWHARTRPDTVSFDADRRWLGLEVRRFHEDGDRAEVEFVARSRWRGRGERLHERSRFVREDGRWLYVDGVLRDAG